jgi:hypothetical protein
MRVAAVLLMLWSSIAFAQAGDSDAVHTPVKEKARVSLSESLPATSLQKGAWDFGFWTQGGHSVSGGVTNTSAFDAGLRIGKVLTGQHGNGWLRGNLEYAADIIPIYVLPGPVNTAYGGAINPFIMKWNFTGGRTLAPYVELGGGVLFTNTEVPFGTSNINFMPQVGVGMHIFTREKRSVTLDFKYVHISNAGMSVPNPGINTLQFGIGYHWMK